MEQLLIFLLFVVASIVSSVLQKKKKRDGQPGGGGAETPVPHWPATGGEWQRELRRLLEGEQSPPAPPALPPRLPASPPAPKPVPRKVPAFQPEPSEGSVVFNNPLTQSSTAYARAAGLAGRVERRLKAVDQRTTEHRKAPLPTRSNPSARAIVQRWTRNREGLRDAFVASLIFDRPPSLQER